MTWKYYNFYFNSFYHRDNDILVPETLLSKHRACTPCRTCKIIQSIYTNDRSAAASHSLWIIPIGRLLQSCWIADARRGDFLLRGMHALLGGGNVRGCRDIHVWLVHVHKYSDVYTKAVHYLRPLTQRHASEWVPACKCKHAGLPSLWCVNRACRTKVDMNEYTTNNNTSGAGDAEDGSSFSGGDADYANRSTAIYSISPDYMTQWWVLMKWRRHLTCLYHTDYRLSMTWQGLCFVCGRTGHRIVFKNHLQIQSNQSIRSCQSIHFKTLILSKHHHTTY